jgi:hypothetical protein
VPDCGVLDRPPLLDDPLFVRRVQAAPVVLGAKLVHDGLTAG